MNTRWVCDNVWAWRFALLNKPRLLVLDEPTNGLDPAGIHEMRDLIRRLPVEFGATVFLSSHLLSEVEQIAGHIGIIHQGRLLFRARWPNCRPSGGNIWSSA